MINATQFHKIADELLQGLADKIEAENDDIELDYLQGILSIILPDGKEYIINKHEPTRQLWLSSPFSGAHKFSYNEKGDYWVSYEKEELLELLENELKNGE